MVIIEGTFLVVGVPIYDEDKGDHKYKDKYKFTTGLQLTVDMEEGQLYRFSVAIDDENTEGTPESIIGRAIMVIWSNAVEVTKAHFQKIKQEKKTVEKILNEKARLWVIGYGSC